MPHSSHEGKGWLIERIRALDPKTMLDVGVGAGTYGDLFAREFPDCRRAGIEVWTPYIERFNLRAKYEALFVHDVRRLHCVPGVFDVVILGDVLEHMELVDAAMVWDWARQSARKAVYLSIPIVHYPQGECEGNPYEEHVVDDYSHDLVMATFPGITAHWTGTEIGVYEAATS